MEDIGYLVNRPVSPDSEEPTAGQFLNNPPFNEHHVWQANPLYGVPGSMFPPHHQSKLPAIGKAVPEDEAIFRAQPPHSPDRWNPDELNFGADRVRSIPPRCVYLHPLTLVVKTSLYRDLLLRNI